jgi:two-component system response regulator GlrR
MRTGRSGDRGTSSPPSVPTTPASPRAGAAPRALAQQGGTVGETQTHQGAVRVTPGAVRRIRLTLLEGPEPGRIWESSGDRCAVGSHALNDFVVEDPTVSRFHCELEVGTDGVQVRDLGSRNGTVVDGVTVLGALLRAGSLLHLGRAILRFDYAGSESNRLLASAQTRFGNLHGTSLPMRTSFALLERAAASAVTVLLEGETGTGKSNAAQSIHETSARANQPFVVVDCGAMPANLLESELFGHERGAFTGAMQRRVGAFEEASGGTIFLDEIGELPQELQPKLLRVLEKREIRRVGSNGFLPVDVRIIAATNRDLRTEVNSGRFRSDLFYRLAVLRIVLPPLRQRPEDVPPLALAILNAIDPGGSAPDLRDPEFLTSLASSAWPGNVRELRNHLERCVVLQCALPLGEGDMLPVPSEEIDPSLPYADARKRAIDAFERKYAAALLERHHGKAAVAAAAAGMDRVYLYRLLRRHGVRG